jgi:hypothetical protein
MQKRRKIRNWRRQLIADIASAQVNGDSSSDDSSIA